MALRGAAAEERAVALCQGQIHGTIDSIAAGTVTAVTTVTTVTTVTAAAATTTTTAAATVTTGE